MNGELIKVKIHTSDRLSFKRCRRRWDLMSDLRQGYKPIDQPRPLAFGTAIHAGFEVYYDPKTWHLTKNPTSRKIIIAAAIEAFLESMRATRDRYLKFNNQNTLDDDQLVEYNDDIDLGIGMLKHYFEYIARKNLDRFTPVAVELKFEVRIWDEDEDPFLPLGYEVVYCGRIDLLLQDEWGEYWVWDHKTTARMRDRMSFLELDEQLGSYNWAIERMLGIRVAGNIYSEVYKGYPQPPALNKVIRLGRKFSVAKNQSTSYDLYLKTITEAGENPALYEEILQFLKAEGIEYVKRTPIHRSPVELRNLREQIKLEVLDMLDPNLRIYPHPNPFSCDYCPVRPVCLAMNDGSDVQWILNQNYKKEPRTNV